MNDIVKADWYQGLIEDCKAIITETIFTSRWALVEGYHNLGERILEDEPKMKQGGSNLSETLQQVAKFLQCSERTLYYSVQFVKKYPILDKVPEGKNITWKKIITKYLPAPKEDRQLIEPPPGKYKTIIVDPPWPVVKIEREVRPKQSAVLDYPIMSIEEIKNCDLITKRFNENCHVYLWATHKFIPVAFEVFNAWGVKYECLLTWVKNVGMTPFSWMYSTEHCLFGRKGSLELLKKGERLDFTAKVREHSRKPNEFYELVSRVSPEPRIDIFAREGHKGFHVAGNEVKKF